MKSSCEILAPLSVGTSFVFSLVLDLLPCLVLGIKNDNTIKDTTEEITNIGVMLWRQPYLSAI